MKKLQLKALELGAREVLTRAQLKNFLGGSCSLVGDNGAPCNSDADCNGGSCYAGSCHGGGSGGCGSCAPGQACTVHLGITYCG